MPAVLPSLSPSYPFLIFISCVTVQMTLLIRGGVLFWVQRPETLSGALSARVQVEVG